MLVPSSLTRMSLGKNSSYTYSSLKFILYADYTNIRTYVSLFSEILYKLKTYNFQATILLLIVIFTFLSLLSIGYMLFI